MLKLTCLIWLVKLTIVTIWSLFFPIFSIKKTTICSSRINKCHNLNLFIYLVKNIMICSSGCMFKWCLHHVYWIWFKDFMTWTLCQVLLWYTHNIECVRIIFVKTLPAHLVLINARFFCCRENKRECFDFTILKIQGRLICKHIFSNSNPKSHIEAKNNLEDLHGKLVGTLMCSMRCHWCHACYQH